MRMDKYGRELDLILILTENASYTAQQIADRLGITRRNLYYYFDYLRDCGFNLQKTGTTYRLDRSSSFFRRLHEQISLSEYGAAYICRRLDSDDTRDHTAVNIRQKLARSFNLPDAVNPELQRRMNDCVAKLREAMATRKMVVLHKYASPHSNTVTDRIVEPYQLMNDERDVRCHEIRSHENKTFRLSRMESVEIIDVPWTFDDRHKQMYTDMFMFTGEQRYTVKMRMGLLSYNLMVEEYPQSAKCFTADGDTDWIFEGEVVSFLGIGRFVLGLYEDIKVIGCEEFKAYLAEKIKSMYCAG